MPVVAISFTQSFSRFAVLNGAVDDGSRLARPVLGQQSSQGRMGSCQSNAPVK